MKFIFVNQSFQETCLARRREEYDQLQGLISGEYKAMAFDIA